MKEACILCGRIAEASKSQGKAEYSITCNTCGIYIYDHFFKGAYLSMREDERAMISAYARECFELGNEPPKLKDSDNLKGIIAEYKSKIIEEKLNNLLFYVRKRSKFLGDSVPWAEEKDYPITYSPYPQESSKIRDLAINRNLLYWKSRDSGLELSGDGWEETEKLQKESIGTMKGKRDQFLIRLNEMSEGKIDKFIDTMRIGDTLDFDRATTFNCTKYFDQEGYIRAGDEGYGEISITAKGIDEANRIQSRITAPSINQEDLPEEKYFPPGSQLDIQRYLARILRQATKSLWICDPYMDEKIVEEISNIRALEIRLLTAQQKGLFRQRLTAAKAQFPEREIEAKVFDTYHDRYYIIDHEQVWTLGASLKNAGGKATLLSKVKNEDTKKKIVRDFTDWWASATAIKI